MVGSVYHKKSPHEEASLYMPGLPQQVNAQLGRVKFQLV